MSRPRLPAGRAAAQTYSLRLKELPESFRGFKIAHISDSHSRPAKGVCDIIRKEKPDITVITGDLFHDDEKPTDKIYDMVMELLELAPVYYVSGNHDLWREEGRTLLELEKTGAVFLDGKKVILERGGAELAIFGIADPYSKKPDEISQSLEKSIREAEYYDGFKILLFHRANLFDEIKDWGFDLILSGHMHGGQVRLPHFGGVLPPSSALFSGKRVFFPKYTAGVICDKATMVINRGIGNTLPIPRWGNRPEVGIITLNGDISL